ncbi:MAG TPA: flavin reductase family protein [Acidimicrobiales bacterium]|nr:flavin reductase family protein [Acidimicrobiales bacterium]
MSDTDSAGATRAAGDTDDITRMSANSFDQARFREVLGHFATGITVVTTRDDSGLTGFTCQSFMSLSLDPPLVAFSPSKSSDTWPRMARVGTACINILSEDHETIARTFAGKGEFKFDGVGYRHGLNGAPILDGAVAWIEGAVHEVHDAGDHHLVVLSVSDVGTAGGEPILFYRGGFGTFHS